MEERTLWEEKFHYSRVIRRGPLIETAGTVAAEYGKAVHVDDAFQQCIYIFNKLEKALQAVEVDLNDVVRTRTYTTDISLAQEIGAAHAETFKEIYPAMTLVEVANLILPNCLVEIELTAWKEQ